MRDPSGDFASGSNDTLLSADLLHRVLETLGMPDYISVDRAGLARVYAAWCENIPFDNIRKMIALREPGAEMPGLDASDFFENWLSHGTGGTCWPSSNALFALLRSLGFDARRVAGSMFDLPEPNHGTVKVKIGGQDWMVDSSMLTYRPLPLNGEIFINDDPAHGVEVEPSNGSYLIWRDFPPLLEYIPCRLQFDPVDTPFYRERYEEFSREQSPFNDRLYFRSGGVEGAWVLLGNTRFRRTDDGLEVREFRVDELAAYLINEAGVSAAMVERWVDSGSLDSTFQPSESVRPEIQGVRPSMRR